MKTKLLLHGTRISMLIMIILAGSLSRTFAQTVIAFDGLNNSFSLFTPAGGTFYSGNSGNNFSGDRPSGSPFASEGVNGYGKSNGVATLTSSSNN